MLIRHHLAAIAAAVLLVACGGGDPAPTVSYDKLVSFGDSLSDVGTHKTAGLAAGGGGKYTVNGPEGKVWVERLAEQLGLALPCPAQTGLNSTGRLASFAAPVANFPACTGYAQGGSRVTNPVGPWNAALLPATQGLLGQLTVPVTTQIANHLATNGNRFRADDLVLALAGGNDLFMLSGGIPTRVAQLMSATPPLNQADATTQASTEAVQAMGVAGAELAALIKTRVIANGASKVVVVNLPNVSITPSSISQGVAAQGLVDAMTKTFNGQLASGLANTSGILLVDAYTRGTTQATDGTFSNATTPACDKNSLFNPLEGASLTCTTGATLAGVDVSRYAYADDVHPTPYAHRVLADYVVSEMQRVGWR